MKNFEKSLKRWLKKSKNIGYSLALLVTFLITGNVSFAETVTFSTSSGRTITVNVPREDNLKEKFEDAKFNSDIDLSKLTTTDNMEYAFSHSAINGGVNLSNLTTANNMYRFFYEATAHGGINISKLTTTNSLGGAFNSSKINGDINLSSLTTTNSLAGAFYGTKINGDINLSSLTTVNEMLGAFNSSTVNNVDLSSLTSANNMNEAFKEVNIIGGGINLSKLTTADNMKNAFYNSTINGGVNLSNLTTADNMKNAFYNSTINGGVNLSNLTTASNIAGAFFKSKIKGNIDLSNLTTLTSDDIRSLFEESKVDGEINLSSLTSANNMYEAFKKTNIGGGINLSSLTSANNMNEAFHESNIGGDINLANITANVNDMRDAFSESTINGDVSLSNLHTVENMNDAFRRSTVNNIDLSSLTTVDDMIGTFASSTVNNIDLSNLTTVNDGRGTFSYSKINNIDLSSLTTVNDARNLFSSSTINGGVNLSNLTTASNIAGAFFKSNINGDVNLSNLTTIDNMDGVFRESTINGGVNLSNLTTTDNMYKAFYGAKIKDSNLNLSNLITTNNMNKAFSNTNLDSIDLSNLTTVNDISEIFSGSTINSGINLANITTTGNMSSAFKDSTINGDVNLSNLTTATNIDSAFKSSTITGGINLANFNGDTTDSTLNFIDGLKADSLSFGTISNKKVYEDIDKNNFGKMNYIKNFDFVYKNVDDKSILDLLQYDNDNYFVINYNDKDNYNLLSGKYAKLDPIFYTNRYTNTSYYKNRFKTVEDKTKLEDNTRYILVKSPLYEDKKQISGEDIVNLAEKLGMELNDTHTDFKELSKANILNSDTVEIDGGGDKRLWGDKDVSFKIKDDSIKLKHLNKEILDKLSTPVGNNASDLANKLDKDFNNYDTSKNVEVATKLSTGANIDAPTGVLVTDTMVKAKLNSIGTGTIDDNDTNKLSVSGKTVKEFVNSKLSNVATNESVSNKLDKDFNNYDTSKNVEVATKLSTGANLDTPTGTLVTDSIVKAKLDTKADKTSVYTKIETDNKLNVKADKDFNNITVEGKDVIKKIAKDSIIVKAGTNTKVDKRTNNDTVEYTVHTDLSNYYNKVEVDDKLNNIVAGAVDLDGQITPNEEKGVKGKVIHKYIAERDKVIINNYEEIQANKKAIAENNIKINMLEKKVNRGLANASAMAGLNYVDIKPNQYAISASVGGYMGTQAIAVGIQVSPKENWYFNAGTSLTSGSRVHAMYNLGVTYRGNFK